MRRKGVVLRVDLGGRLVSTEYGLAPPLAVAPPIEPFDATAAEVQEALEGMYGAGNVEVTGARKEPMPTVETCSRKVGYTRLKTSNCGLTSRWEVRVLRIVRKSREGEQHRPLSRLP